MTCGLSLTGLANGRTVELPFAAHCFTLPRLEFWMWIILLCASAFVIAGSFLLGVYWITNPDHPERLENLKARWFR